MVFGCLLLGARWPSVLRQINQAVAATGAQFPLPPGARGGGGVPPATVVATHCTRVLNISPLTLCPHPFRHSKNQPSFDLSHAVCTSKSARLPPRHTSTMASASCSCNCGVLFSILDLLTGILVALSGLLPIFTFFSVRGFIIAFFMTCVWFACLLLPVGRLEHVATAAPTLSATCPQRRTFGVLIIIMSLAWMP